MHGHVPPDAAGGGEDHVAAAALEHLLAGLVRGQVTVQAPAAEGHQYNCCIKISRNFNIFGEGNSNLLRH